MPRILISGATGFVGTPLTHFFSSQGHSVVSYSHDHPIDFEGFDIVIHLAGEPLTPSRWSREKRKKILESRSLGTEVLANGLAAAKHPPKLFISASATGYYGNRGDELLTEISSAGKSFLSTVCSAWESASGCLERRGTRVVHARFGLVLGVGGGMLQKLLLPFKLGVGGNLGSGRQWMSWIALDDLISAFNHVISTQLINGAVNFVSPNPVRQEEFASTLAGILHRPHFVSTPGWALKLVLGKTADELILSSARVQPVKLLASNFHFLYPDLRSALCKALQIT